MMSENLPDLVTAISILHPEDFTDPETTHKLLTITLQYYLANLTFQFVSHYKQKLAPRSDYYHINGINCGIEWALGKYRFTGLCVISLLWSFNKRHLNIYGLVWMHNFGIAICLTAHLHFNTHTTITLSFLYNFIGIFLNSLRHHPQ